MMDYDFGVSQTEYVFMFVKNTDPMLFADDLQEPIDKLCEVVPGHAGVFRREWTKVFVELNCTSYEATFEWKNGTTQTYDVEQGRQLGNL